MGGGVTGRSGSGQSRLRQRAEQAARIVFWIGLFAGLAYIFLKAHQLAHAEGPIKAGKIDFLAFWAAAKLALAGEALAAFDPRALEAAAGLPPHGVTNLLWLYPPGFLVLLAPLGALPFWAAWAAFVVLSAICLGLAARGPAIVLPGGWRLIVVAPAVLIGSLATGQNSVLWTAVLVAGLWALQQDQARRAGLLLALLTLKPQLALLIPLALAAAGQWRALGWVCLGAAALALALTLPFGLDYWRQFLAGLAGAVNQVETGMMPIPLMASVYAFVRGLGAEHGPALWCQWAATACTVLAIVWTWSRQHLGWDIKCAAL